MKGRVTMEKGEDEILKLKSVEIRRVAGASDSQQPEGLLEDSLFGTKHTIWK